MNDEIKRRIQRAKGALVFGVIMAMSCLAGLLIVAIAALLDPREF
jgi:hypothetical protein